MVIAVYYSNRGHNLLNPNNLTKQQLYSIHEHFCGTVFGGAPYFGIWFDDKEIKYIESKMQTHKLYRLVSGKAAGISISEKPRCANFVEIWLLSFLEDKEIPIGVKGYIHIYIGHMHGDLKVKDSFENSHTYDDFIAQQFLNKLWMEKCH